MTFRKLIDGYIAFRDAYFEKDPSLYQKLVSNGQNPEVLIIACSDSRIDPAILTTSDPGDLFVIRNVAAIVPPYESATGHQSTGYHGTSSAIEFAVKVLKVKHIIVMGHSLCGGVKALADKDVTNETFDFIGPWINIGKDALDAVNRFSGSMNPQERQKALEQALILTSLENLMTFPWIRDKAEQDLMTLHGWYFDLQRGALEEYDPAASRFENVLSLKSRPCGCHDFSLDRLLYEKAS